jgi:2-phospho-L-lactate guanylyltransferase (CobY/MobA/RfbA family)
VPVYIVPYRANGKTRLGDASLGEAMMLDVVAACRAAGGGDVVVADSPGGQGEAVLAALAGHTGAAIIVNSDLPSVTPAELRELAARAPALVAATDGTTNAIAVDDARAFVPAYGEASASRYADALGAATLSLPGLVADVDTWEDLERVRVRVGSHTRRYLETLVSA